MVTSSTYLRRLKRTTIIRVEYEQDNNASGQGLLESPCKCGIEPPGFISHGVSEEIFLSAGKGLLVKQGGLVCVCSGLTISVTYNILVF